MAFDLRPTAIHWSHQKDTVWAEPGDFQAWLDKGGKEFLKRDLRVHEDRVEAAKFLGIEPEWEAKTKSHRGNTPLYKILYDFYYLLAKEEPKDLWKMSPIEMWHRIMALCHFYTCSRVDHGRASLTSGTLKEIELIFDGKDTATKEVTQNVLMKAWEAAVDSNSNSLVNPLMSVKVHAVTTKDYDMATVCNAARIDSANISFAKIESAAPSPFVNIGDYVSSELKSMNEDSISHCPDFGEKIMVPVTKVMTLKQANADLAENKGDVSKAWGGMCPLLKDPRMERYNRDPFDPEAREDVRNLLSVKSIEGDKTLYPPFFLDHDRISREPGKVGREWQCTSLIFNSWYLCAPLAHYLMAGHKNEHVSNMKKDKKVLDIINYTNRFHLGAQSFFQSNTAAHAAMEIQYNLEYKPQKHTNQVEGGFIAALTAMISMINACLSYASVETNSTPKEKLDQVKKMADLISGAMKGIEGKQTKPQFDDTLKHLGMKIFIFVINFQLHPSNRVPFSELLCNSAQCIRQHQNSCFKQNLEILQSPFHPSNNSYTDSG